jgi:hypothetical protein
MRRVVSGRVIGACKLPSEHAVLHAPKLSMFMAASYPASPPSVDWTSAAITVLYDIEGNDTHGDCVEAEDAHYIGVLTGNAGTIYAYTDAQTLADYSAITGFNPSDPSTDQGTDPVASMNYRVTTGYADGSKDAGWVMVDATSQAEVEYAINTFGNIKMWFGIPDSIVNAIPQSGGFVWDVSAGAPNQNNGHCIGGYGFNPTSGMVVGVTAQGVIIATWGMLGVITWAALAAWFIPSQGGGLAVRVSKDWVSKASGKTPEGLDVVGLITGFNTYFNQSLPIPTPTPPGPGPTPSGPVTLAEAQAWATAGVNKGFPLQTRASAAAAASAGLAAGWPQS